MADGFCTAAADCLYAAAGNCYVCAVSALAAANARSVLTARGRHRTAANDHRASIAAGCIKITVSIIVVPLSTADARTRASSVGCYVTAINDHSDAVAGGWAIGRIGTADAGASGAACGRHHTAVDGHAAAHICVRTTDSRIVALSLRRHFSAMNIQASEGWIAQRVNALISLQNTHQSSII